MGSCRDDVESATDAEDSRKEDRREVSVLEIPSTISTKDECLEDCSDGYELVNRRNESWTQLQEPSTLTKTDLDGRLHKDTSAPGFTDSSTNTDFDFTGHEHTATTQAGDGFSSSTMETVGANHSFPRPRLNTSSHGTGSGRSRGGGGGGRSTGKPLWVTLHQPHLSQQHHRHRSSTSTAIPSTAFPPLTSTMHHSSVFSATEAVHHPTYGEVDIEGGGGRVPEKDMVDEKMNTVVTKALTSLRAALAARKRDRLRASTLPHSLH